MSDQDKIVMFNAPESAKSHTMDGWLSRDGYFYMDERTARYAGCTHRPCDDCGQPVPKMYVRCASCREKQVQARYEAMPAAPWDGVQMVYSEKRDEYYASPDDAEDELDDDESVAALRLVLCTPNHVRSLDCDDFADDLPEDGEAPDELLAAIDAFNEATSGVVLSWRPGKSRLRAEEGSGDE